MFDDYREIPLKVFMKVLKDESKLSDLLPGIDSKTWESFKEKFEEDNPTDEDNVKIQKQRNVLYPSSKLHLYSTLIQFSLLAPDSWEKMFDSAGVKRKDTLLESIEAVNKMMSKEKVKYNINDAQLKQFLEDIPEREETEHNIFDVISSLSAVTGNRLDYNTATIGELLAEQKLAKRIAERNNEKNG